MTITVGNTTAWTFVCSAIVWQALVPANYYSPFLYSVNDLATFTRRGLRPFNMSGYLQVVIHKARMQAFSKDNVVCVLELPCENLMQHL